MSRVNILSEFFRECKTFFTVFSVFLVYFGLFDYTIVRTDLFYFEETDFKEDIMPDIVTYPIAVSSLPEDFRPFRIVHLSDLHGQVFGKNNSLLLQQISRLSPDLIVMSGDMIDGGRRQADAYGRQAFLRLCRALSPLCPVFYSLGNHELEMPKPHLSAWLKKIGRTGVTVLDNQRTDIVHDGVVFPVFGLTMPLLYYKDPLKKPYDRHASWTQADMETIFGSSPKCGSEHNGPSILLAHNPLFFPAYRDWGADITFSGHVHGGIIRLPGIGGVLSPDMTLFPKYDGGCFSETSSRSSAANPKIMVVSRGLSDTFLKRILNPMEIVCAVISADSSHVSPPRA